MNCSSLAYSYAICILLAAGFLGVNAEANSQQPLIQGEDRFFCCSAVRTQCVNTCAGVDCNQSCYGSCGILGLFKCGPIKCGDVAPNTCKKSTTTKTSTTTTSTTTTSTTTKKK